MTAVLAVTTLGTSLAACGGPEVKDDPNVLQTYACDLGYGTDWLPAILDAFAQKDWVKEKYPNLTIAKPVTNTVRTFAINCFEAGQKSNPYDVLFSMENVDALSATGKTLELTDSVFNQKVPGEDILYKDKMNNSARLACKYLDQSNLEGADRYYYTHWAGGMDSIIYNETILSQFDLSVPKTTDELINACAVIKENEGKDNGKYKKGYSIIQSDTDANYFSYLFPVWWAQYDGIQTYLNFWNGLSDGRYSNQIFEETGRLESMKVMEEVLDSVNGYRDTASSNYEFMQAQTAFLQGNGVFHANGDWFTNEMNTTVKTLTQRGEMGGVFKTMRPPVVSALGKKLGITDAELSAVVDYVDGERSEIPTINSSRGYTAEQIVARVTEARSVNHSIGPAHQAVIPSYSEAKDVAVDFLRFMATDEALLIYMQKTNGASLPFNYDVKTKSPETYASFASTAQSVIDFKYNPVFEVYSLPTDESFPLNKYGGLKAIIYGDVYMNFVSSVGKYSAQKIFDDTKAFWTTAKFNEALAKAGLN